MRRYPICVLGLGIKRWEKYPSDKKYPSDPADEYWNRSGLLIWGDRSAQSWGPTHLQKKSLFGFLIQWPLCFHFWIQFRPQQTKPETGEHIPGSEIVFYWRFGFWRWDAGMEKYIGPGTWFLGGHWD